MPKGASPFQYGFKAKCQRQAADQRALLGLSPSDRLSPRDLADHHKILLRTPSELPSLPLEALTELMDASSGNPDTWSAISLDTAQGPLTIYNPTHTPERVNNTLSHEIAHFLLGHPHGQMRWIDGHLIRDYNERHEKEADWLAAVLLLPDTSIRYAARRGWGLERTASHHQVSIEIARWRWGASGVDRYMRARA